MEALQHWLASHGLEDLTRVLEAADIGVEDLLTLTDGDLATLGLSLGQRRRLVQELSAIGDESSHAERRHLLVMFCDVVDSTELSQRMDLEALRSILRDWQTSVGRIVTGAGGHVAQYLGDGVMAYFGWPNAHEDDVDRGLRAALDICEASIGINSPEPLATRVGLHVGYAIVETMSEAHAAGLDTAVGSTPTIAFRLQGLAEPGQVVASEAVTKLASAEIEATYLGERLLKGISTGVRAFRIHHVGRTRRRLGDASNVVLTPFVGRDGELNRLLTLWETAAEGKRQIVNLRGEPGIGKSRLMYELTRALEEKRINIHQGHCSEQGQRIPFMPFAQLIRDSFGISPSASSGSISRRLKNGLEMLGIDKDSNLPYLEYLLGVRSVPTLENLDSESIGVRTRDTLERFVVERCRWQPTILVFEDLHWIDASSRLFLMRLLELKKNIPLLIICTFRPEFEAPWHDHVDVNTIDLAPLSSRESLSLARQRLEAASKFKRVDPKIIDRADGNPLFIEELVAYLTESQDLYSTTLNSDAGQAAIPTTLENLLRSRLDRLAEDADEVLKIAAVIGRNFDNKIVKSQMSAPEQFDNVITLLQKQSLIDLVDTESGTRYRFRHALIREAVYDGLLRDQRQAMHLSIARAIESDANEKSIKSMHELAYHFSRTGQFEKALRYLSLAADENVRIYALEDARENFESGSKLINQYVDELDFELVCDSLISYGNFLYITGENKKCIQLFRPLLPRVKSMQDRKKISRFCIQLGLAYWSMNEADSALELIEYASEIAVQENDSLAIGYVNMALAWIEVFWGPLKTGRVKKVEEYAEAAVAIGETQGDHWLVANALHILAISSLTDGNPRKGRVQTKRLLELVEAGAEFPAREFALVDMAYIDLFNNEPEEAIAKIREIYQLTLSPVMYLGARSIHGAALALSQKGEEAKKILTEVVDEMEKLGYQVGLTAVHQYLGLAKVLAGEFVSGVKYLEESRVRYKEMKISTTIPGIHALFLGEIYLSIAQKKQKPEFGVILRNLPFLLSAMFNARRKARQYLEMAASDFCEIPSPANFAWCIMDLGFLALLEKRQNEARERFSSAIEIAESVDSFVVVERCQAALKAMDSA